jgi:signal transduction histidine kinase/FixJ family two-component response regulator
MAKNAITRMVGVAAAALLLAGLLSQTAFYSRIAWWLEDAQQRALGRTLPLDHVVIFDVDEESMQRLAPRVGAWPYPRDLYADALRYLSEKGARAIVFDILFSEARRGDERFAAVLDRRSVLAAAALPYPLERGVGYRAQLGAAAIASTASHPQAAALARNWSDLTLPLPAFTAVGRARIGVMSAVADADGVVRRLSPLHQAYDEILPTLPLAALLAAEPDSVFSLTDHEYRVGRHAWPASRNGAVTLRLPGNSQDLAVVPFYELARAAGGAQGMAHIEELVRGRIVFVGSSSAVLGDFAFTSIGRLPGLHLNALVTELLIEGQTLRPPALWMEALLLALALGLPLGVAWRGAAARPREFLLGLPLLAAVVAGAGMALFALNQQSHWLFALIAGVAAQACALLAWLLALHRERQRLYYEKLAAQEASRMKSEFLTHMTHELRTPVTAIMGFNKINQLTNDLGREQRVRNSEIIARSCEHLLGLVSSNLDLARIEAGQLEIERRPENAASLLDDVASTLRVIAEQKGLRLELAPTDALPAAVSIDGFRVRQVLINLLGNAIKFTERGVVALEARWSAGELELLVRDTGPGIPEDSMQRVFEPFQRAVGSKLVGAGMGLTITQQLVGLMGGTIAVRSTVGEGTTFEVRVPAAEASLAEAEPAAPALPLAPLSGRVLVAEDHEALRQLVEVQLRELGVQYRIVENGFAAVEAARAERFDAILLDMDMPLMDGYEAVQVLRRRGYDWPIVAFTAHGDGPAVERALMLGCDAVVRKPVTIDRLGAALEALLGKGAPARREPIAIDRRIADLVPRFIEVCQKECVDLRRAFAAERWIDASRIGHTLRGSGGGYGLDEITRLGQAIQEAADARDAAQLSALAERLDGYLALVLQALEKPGPPVAAV